MVIRFRNIIHHSSGIFLLFVVLSVTLRFFSFFPVLLDHDESTYLEIAREMVEGKMLYVDLIDIKPPGIFLIYAFFQLVFGHSIFVMRLLVALLIALTSFMIFKTNQLFIPHKRVAIAGGLIYIFFVSTWTRYGVSPNIELFFNLFTISSLYVLMKRDHWLNFLGAGLLMGAGFIIKYVVLFDFAAFLLFFLIRALRRPERSTFRRLMFMLVISFAAFLGPFILVNLYFLLTGHFEVFAEIAYFTVARYPKQLIPWDMVRFVMDFYLLFLPIHLMFFYVLFNKSLWRKAGTDLPLLSVIWVVFVLVSVTITGNHFTHYFIQVMLPVSLFSGFFFHPDNHLPFPVFRLTRGGPGLIILASLCIVIVLFSRRDHFRVPDTPEVIAEYLKPRMQEADVLYVANNFHILYYLLEKDCPTPYVHPSLLTSPSHREALQVDLEKELQRIMYQKPKYILVQEKGRNQVDWLYPFLNEYYIVEMNFERRMVLYRWYEGLKGPAP